MKNWKPYLLAVLAISMLVWISLSQNPKAEDLLNNKDQKQEIFQAILNNPEVAAELMDTLMKNPQSQEKWLTRDTETKDSMLHLTNVLGRKKIIYLKDPP